jgi:protein-S-isoprenylcysteine O-methyltransferase Ste14
MLWSIVALVVYFVLWAALHSLLASMPVKGWVRHTFGPRTARWYRLAFNLIAGVTILPLLVMAALLPDHLLYVVRPPWRWIMIGGQALSLGALLWAATQTGPSFFLGLSQLFARDPTASGSLQVRGFYCHVRHPLYLFSILLLWLTPAMTANLLTLYGLTTLYFYLGSIHEETRLLAKFGTAYADYRARVPRLIPRLRRCYPPTPVAGWDVKE